jgi:hypothetical protein
MMIDLIATGSVYRYARTLKNGPQKGRILVGERVKKRNGWYVIGHDHRNNRYLELRPNQVLGPVFDPSPKDLAPTVPGKAGRPAASGASAAG